jgi:protein-S-isoprenylcysteine O-methyltransferase Ste14
MLPQRLVAALLLLPLLILVAVSVRYWFAYGKQEKHGSGKRHIGYNRFFLTRMAVGYLSIWPLWVGEIVMLFLNRAHAAPGVLILSSPLASLVQIVGLALLYVGSLFFAWAIGSAGTVLRPSTSGVHAGHRVVQDGPLGIVRHPYYVSYVLILLGLSLTLVSPWPLLPALCVVIGMGPTARTEEEELVELFGQEYKQYQQRVGRFFPNPFW